MNFTALRFNSFQMRLIFARSGYENCFCSFVVINYKKRGERNNNGTLLL